MIYYQAFLSAIINFWWQKLTFVEALWSRLFFLCGEIFRNKVIMEFFFKLTVDAAYAACVNFINEWQDLRFKVDSKRQMFEKLLKAIFFTVRVIASNLQKKTRRRNIFIFPVIWTGALRLISQHTNNQTTATSHTVFIPQIAALNGRPLLLMIMKFSTIFSTEKWLPFSVWHFGFQILTLKLFLVCSH